MKTGKGRGWVRPGYLAVAVTFVMLAAAGFAFVASNNTATAATTVSFSQDILPMFAESCTMCHGGERPSGRLDLTAEAAYDQLVGVQAGPFQPGEDDDEDDVVEFFRVTPYVPEVSYLLHKLLGTQAAVGGRGGQMPRGLDPWTDEQLNLVRQWILAGAPNN